MWWTYLDASNLILVLHVLNPLALPKHHSPQMMIFFPNMTLYRSMVSGFQYLILTRPDIAFAVNQVAERWSAPTQRDIRSIKRIFQYLKGTLFRGLTFHHFPSLHLLAYSDVDWAADVATRHSISSGCVFLGRNLISWTANKQSTVSCSSAEFEYRALAHVTADVQWFFYLLRELDIPLYSSLLLLCDNQSALHMAANSVFYAHTRHIDIDLHFIRKLVAHGALRLRHVPTAS
ncbi:hypothetical protein Pint_25534 [Pistacia integerrima]|uniref:Uncharacterized protein n=1 Tax=Pistacia integerrima TaxID=434235 RepID=A0ACC0YCK4_9ROSI|nr:hypothetical protein Pint_25534 [Pistacia integerrima]